LPAVSEAGDAEIERLCGAVPLVGETESQEESEVAVNVRVPVPVLDTDTAPGLGFSPPWEALKVRLKGLTPRTGCAEMSDPEP
jgi:hypothetical protein